MSVCLMDLGNSRYKWIAADQLDRADAVRVASYLDTVDASVRALVEALAQQAPWQAIVVSSVKGEAFDTLLSKACEAHFGVTPLLLRTGCVAAFPSAYHEPQLLGVDRYVALLGARDTVTVPAIVVDAGTAVTFDALDEQGRHAGGCIFPGITLLGKTLLRDTARILLVADNAGSVLGRSTAEGAAGGVHSGFVGAARGIIGEMQQQFSKPVTIILTGGDAAMLARELALPVRLDPLLVFRGIAKAHQAIT